MSSKYKSSRSKPASGKEENRNEKKTFIYKLWQEETEESGFRKLNRFKQGLLIVTTIVSLSFNFYYQGEPNQIL